MEGLEQESFLKHCGLPCVNNVSHSFPQKIIKHLPLASMALSCVFGALEGNDWTLQASENCWMWSFHSRSPPLLRSRPSRRLRWEQPWTFDRQDECVLSIECVSLPKFPWKSHHLPSVERKSSKVTKSPMIGMLLFR